MPNSPIRLIALNMSPETAEDLRCRLAFKDEDPPVLAEVYPPGVSVPEDPAEAEMAVLDAEGDAASAFRLLADVRRRFPYIPMFVATGTPEASARAEAVTVGDGLFVVDRSIDDQSFEALVRNSVVAMRNSGGSWPVAVDAAVREMQDLDSVCGPAPLSALTRLLGSRPLQQAVPAPFRSMSDEYKALLDEALTMRPLGKKEPGVERLQALADRLGALNAGPRDLIDLHRLSIAEKLRDQPPQKAKAYVEEGRLVLVQLMRYLVSFYRSLSWGGRRAAKSRN